ncbi:MAG TPA: hypothetical protein VG126_11575 [Thermoleophilaceae bacterium]|nr:hypothetical protein [Thermoleophilaceae bacterium]
MKRPVALSALVVAATLLAPASAEAIIQLDRGIAGARLGNTKAEVKTALGQPKRIRNGTNDFGPFTVFVYAGRINVTFQSGNTVTAVTTRGLGDRTARGIGVRSTRAAVEQRVPGVDCNTFMGTTICQRGEGLPGERVTAFFVRNGRVVRVTVGIVID